MNAIVSFKPRAKKSKPTDWNAIYFLSSHLYDRTVADAHYAYTDAKIVSLPNELQRLANLSATSDTIKKYPDWPYKSNKRAENFLRRMERKHLLTGPSKVYESIEVMDNNTLRFVVDTTNEEAIYDKALDLYMQWDQKTVYQQFGTPIQVKDLANHLTVYDEDKLC
jgi:hypothetical protein